MLWKLSRFMLVVLLLGFAGLRAEADTVAVGEVSFDDLGGGGGAPFGLDIFNFTVPFGGSEVSTLLTFTEVTAEVTLEDGTKGAASFLPPDGFSDYTSQSMYAAGAVESVVVSGMIGPTVVTLADGSQALINSPFTATITDGAGALEDGDYALINVNTSPIVAGVAEPGTWGLLLAGLLGVVVWRKLA